MKLNKLRSTQSCNNISIFIKKISQSCSDKLASLPLAEREEDFTYDLSVITQNKSHFELDDVELDDDELDDDEPTINISNNYPRSPDLPYKNTSFWRSL